MTIYQKEKEARIVKISATKAELLFMRLQGFR